MMLPLIRTQDSTGSNKNVGEPLDFKQITFTVTTVSPQSPIKYHIEEDEHAVHVFLNRPLSRLDLDTIREILRKAEKPCHRRTKFPVSAPPSPNLVNPTSNSNHHLPSSQTTNNMKFRKSLFIPSGLTSQDGGYSPIQPSPNHRGNDGHKGGGAGGKPRQIHFYDRNKPHYGFTNFSDHSVKYKGQVYPTSEHLFQSLKFVDRQPYVAELIRLSARPRDAFDLAHQHRHLVRDDWFQVNIRFMDDVLWHKFTQHDDLKRELLATGDAELIEASDNDSFWGWGADHKGRNELGKALMRLRMKLR